MGSVAPTFDLERHSAAGGGRDGDHMQLLFVVSDGRFGTRGKDVKRWIREALKRNVFIVFIITDAARPNAINLATQPHPNAPVDDEEAEVRAKRAKRSSNKKKTTAAALRKNGVSATAGRVRVRAAATAAASTISRMISADQAPANLTEAWSFSSAPSSPSFSATASVPSSPGAQAYAESDEDDDHDEEYTEELIEEEYVEEEQQEPEQELEEDEDDGDEDEDAYESDDASSTGANANEEVEFNFDLPQFEITPGEESPGTSFSYEAGHSISGHEQNLRLQQQLQQSLPASTQAQAQFAIPQPPQQHQQQQSMGYFEPSAFYDFVSPDLEMPLSAINQVNLAEDFGWSVPSMPSAVVDNCASAYHHQHQQAHYYQQHQQHQQQPVHSYLLADQLPATQCSDLAEWVAHYCN